MSTAEDSPAYCPAIKGICKTAAAVNMHCWELKQRLAEELEDRPIIKSPILKFFFEEVEIPDWVAEAETELAVFESVDVLNCNLQCTKQDALEAKANLGRLTGNQKLEQLVADFLPDRYRV